VTAIAATTTMVHEAVRRALNQLKLGRKDTPIWLDTIQRLHPPIRFSPPPIESRLRNGRRKPILPVPKPPKIIFAEDRHRNRLYKNHEKEANRPALLDENNIINNSDNNSNSNNSNNSNVLSGNPLTIDRVINIQLDIMEGNPKISIDKAYESALEQYEKEKTEREIRLKVARQSWNDTVIKMNAQNVFSSSDSIIEENLKKEKDALNNQKNEKKDNQ